MQVAFRASFARDLKKITDEAILDRVRAAIVHVESAKTLRDIADMKKLSGYQHLYRIRIGDYRIGIAVVEGVIEFVRCLSRREIYRFFP